MAPTSTCSCCWDSDIPLYSCTEGHFSCSECLHTGIQILINENRNRSCISDCCDGYYRDDVLQSVIKDSQLIKKYNINNFANMLSKIRLDNLFQCPFCPNRVIIEEADTTFYCMDGCKKYSCIRCKKAAHDGPCNPGLHFQDELKTQEFLITCCGVSFFRGDACNKVSCPRCGKYFCWICKQQIADYKHFKNSTCKLYGERPQIVFAQNTTTIRRVPQNVVRHVRVQPNQNGGRRRAVRCSGITLQRRQCNRFTLSASGFCQTHH